MPWFSKPVEPVVLVIIIYDDGGMICVVYHPKNQDGHKLHVCVCVCIYIYIYIYTFTLISITTVRTL